MKAKAYFWANLNGAVVNTPLSHCEVIGHDGKHYELLYRAALISGAVNRITMWLPRDSPYWPVLSRAASDKADYFPEAFLTLVEPKRSGRPNRVLKYRLQGVSFLTARTLLGSSNRPCDMVFSKAEETCAAR